MDLKSFSISFVLCVSLLGVLHADPQDDLIKAILEKDVKGVESALKNGANPNCVILGRTPLRYVVVATCGAVKIFTDDLLDDALLHRFFSADLLGESLYTLVHEWIYNVLRKLQLPNNVRFSKNVVYDLVPRLDVSHDEGATLIDERVLNLVSGVASLDALSKSDEWPCFLLLLGKMCFMVQRNDDYHIPVDILAVRFKLEGYRDSKNSYLAVRMAQMLINAGARVNFISEKSTRTPLQEAIMISAPSHLKNLLLERSLHEEGEQLVMKKSRYNLVYNNPWQDIYEDLSLACLAGYVGDCDMLKVLLRIGDYSEAYHESEKGLEGKETHFDVIKKYFFLRSHWQERDLYDPSYYSNFLEIAEILGDFSGSLERLKSSIESFSDEPLRLGFYELDAQGGNRYSMEGLNLNFMFPKYPNPDNALGEPTEFDDLDDGECLTFCEGFNDEIKKLSAEWGIEVLKRLSVNSLVQGVMNREIGGMRKKGLSISMKQLGSKKRKREE